jgi:arginine decarboxylase
MPVQGKTPIVSALKKYIDDGIVRFHMPGHKGSPFLDPSIECLLGYSVFRADVTNVPGMDDIHRPDGIIKEAEQLAATVFGAEYTYFLINGSSCGLQALVMTACDVGDKILVPRNIHRSILGGIILSGAVPIFCLPEYDTTFEIPLGISPDTIRMNLEQHSGIKAVLVVNPTYHGIASDIGAISSITNEYGIPLLVDEAHGPHFRFHSGLPLSSLEQGADAVVHGTHKILGALTQASMLHVKSRRINLQRLEAILKLLQSTSSSYILLASLDAARAQVEEAGVALIEKGLRTSALIREQVQRIEGIRTFGSEIIGRPGVAGFDSTKVTISFKQSGVSGFKVEEMLREKYNIQVEMADLYNILLLVTFGNTEGEAHKLLDCLKDICRLIFITCDMGREILKLGLPTLPELVVSPRVAFFSLTKAVLLEEAATLICGEMVACYPPGIPIICPGERITSEVIEYLLTMRSMGARFQGCYDHELRYISVLK